MPGEYELKYNTYAFCELQEAYVDLEKFTFVL
jgi:hypothetical protein